MDDIYSLDDLYTNDDVPEELYQLVRQGLHSQLNTRLSELSNSMEYITTLTSHSQGRLSLLMVAALNGFDEVVRVLLSHCDPKEQIELEGHVKLSDKQAVRGATALHCACYQEHFIVVKTLIELGNANVTEETYDYPYYSPLIHAIEMNRVNVVRFLIENGYSDVNEIKSFDHDQRSPLIFAVSCGSITLVKYLIDHGANINYSCVYKPSNIYYPRVDKRSNIVTPVSYAMVDNRLEILQLLYERGAIINSVNPSGENFLEIAIQNQYYSIINFLLERSIYTVEDLEIAACSLIFISSPIEYMYTPLQLLKIALEQRESMNLPKVCIQPIAAYDYQLECQTIDELDNIKNDLNRILIESLLIRERIFLLRRDIAIIKPLHAYGELLVARNEFDKCLDVWIHMFYLYQQVNMPTALHRFVWVFCKILTANQRIYVERFLQVCQLTFESSQMGYKDLNVLNALFLVIILIKILEQNGISKEEQISIYCWITDLCRHRLTAEDGRTLLHYCVDSRTLSLISFKQQDILQHIVIPNEPALRLLLSCGIRWLDLDARDSTHMNTALHVICLLSTKDEQIIKLFLDAGCHIDCVNKYGMNPMYYISDEKIRALFMPKRTPWNLKCLCARIIAKDQLNTESFKVLSSKLKYFVILHGSSS